MKYIKGFDKNLKCRDFQFEIGKTYDTGAKEDELKLCSDTVFHFCESIQQVHKYYDVRRDNRYCEVEVLGKIVRDNTKCGSYKIKIVREIVGKELEVLLGQINKNIGIFNTGHCNTGHCNTGDRNTGHWNTGDRNTGDRNTGNCNTGHWNTGNRNTGHCNTGNCNTGHWNTGDRNTGDRNTGHWNTGHWNKSDRSTGLFNTKNEHIMIFNKDSGLTYDECYDEEWFKLLFRKSFILTEWITYTEEEKKDSPIRQSIGGYLKAYSYKEACTNWWNQYDDEDKKYLINNIPNFDKEIFKEITGIEVKL